MSEGSSERIVASLGTWIATVPAGTRVPSNRALCAQHAASPVTVQKAVRALTALGLVESRPGVGTFVRAERELAAVGLADRATHYPAELSGGEQQRTALARALAPHPAILVADEPTGNLDTRTSREVIEMFRKLNEETRLTVILVTHDQAVARHARRQLVLRDGEIICDTNDSAEAIAALHAADD